MTTVRSFSRVLDKLNVSPTTPVAVAVSGGCDSLALTLLAKKIFNRVIGITVDHRLRKESKVEAIKVGELVQSLGVEHHTVDLDWGEEGAPVDYRGSTRKNVKMKSYTALLETCEELDIQTLFLGHHHDDHNALFLTQLSWEGIMDQVFYWPGYPGTRIVRPLLEWRKSDIVEVCRSEGMELCASEGTTFDSNLKKVWSNVVKVCPSVADGLSQLVTSTCEARQLMNQRVSKAVNTIPTIDTKLGCLYLSNSQLRALPLFVRRRVLHVLASYIAGYPIKNKLISLVENLCKELPLSKPTFVGDIVFIPMRDRLCIGKGKPTNTEGLPIEVGKPVLWDRRWLVTVLPLPECNKRSNGCSVFAVDSLSRPDWSLARCRGIRKVRTTPLPELTLRPGLPVVRNKENKAVFIPHLQVMDRTYGLSCNISFQPITSLEITLSTCVDQ